jgi:hypothetical protein
MPIDPNDPVHESNEDSHLGYEHTDVHIPGIVVFLSSLGLFLGVFFILCYVMGKVITIAWYGVWLPKATELHSNPAGGRQEAVQPGSSSRN